MESFSYGIAHLISAVEGVDKQMKVWNRNLTEAREDLKIQNQIVSEPFAETEKLKQKRSRYNEVMDILNPPKEEQKLDTDGGDAVQYQQRNRDDNKPKKRKKATYNEAETLFMIWENSSAPVGEVKRFARFGKFRYYEKTETGAIELSRKQYNERSKYNAQDIDRRAEREIGQVANFNGGSKGNEAGTVDGNRNSGGAAAVLGQAFREELRDDTGRSVSGSSGYSFGTTVNSFEETQYQQRHKVLTNREVLEMAVDELELSDLTPGERSALDIFKDRLDNLKDLQEQRAEQGRLYREQQFCTKVDRAEAEKTLNRMKVLDGQIEKAELITAQNQSRLMDMRKEYIDGTDTGRKTFTQMAEDYELQRRRGGWNYDAAGYTGVSGSNDAVDVEESESDAFGSYWESLGYNSWEEVREAIENGAIIPDEDGDPIVLEQYQQRYKVLTNREVLEMAVDELEVSDLTPGERSALDIYESS